MKRKMILSGAIFNPVLNDSGNHNKTKKHFNLFDSPLKLFLIVIALLFLNSCSRNTSSGCGTWPSMNAKTYKSHYR